jgi:arylsulfatase
MFGHRGVIADGWKAVAFHPPGTAYDGDQWELFYLPDDFSEANDLAAEQPDKLAEMIDLWWQQAEKHQVLPLDDRFGPRFAENAARRLGDRRVFTFHAGMGHIPTDIAPDLRDRSFRIDAHATVKAGDQGVLIAHGDATCGYSLYIRDGRLTYDQNVGEHQVVTADRPVDPGTHVFSLKATKGEGGLAATLLIDGAPVGTGTIRYGFVNFISWSGLDIGQDRSSPVSHYPAPFRFTGALEKVVVTLDGGAPADAEGAAAVAIARE